MYPCICTGLYTSDSIIEVIEKNNSMNTIVIYLYRIMIYLWVVGILLRGPGGKIVTFGLMS